MHGGTVARISLRANQEMGCAAAFLQEVKKQMEGFKLPG
jgi:hypothetical protein